MCAPVWLVVVSGLIPLTTALLANRSTSLVHAICWAIVAWAGWIVSVADGSIAENYLALALTGCAGIAVFGARWPGAAAWNFVVAGLLVVLLLPLSESLAVGADVQPGTMRTVFLALLIGITVMNYLPTRLGGAALLLAVGCGLEFERILAGRHGVGWSGWFVGLAPWVAWLGLRLRRNAISADDRMWQDFRDRYGLVWSLRLRDQFNRAAANAGLTCELRWSGLRGDTASKANELLNDLTKRFFG